MNKFKKRVYWILGIPFLILAVTAILWLKSSNYDIVEQMKKGTAKIRKVEYIPNQNFQMEERLVFHQKDSIYNDFRSKFKYHFQTIGLATFSDSSRLILISDPPSYFHIDTIKSVFANFTHGMETKQHKVGYDGHITDIVISVGNATEENMVNLTNKLSEILFFPLINHKSSR